MYDGSLIEHTVKKEYDGSFAKRKKIAVACYVIVPIVLSVADLILFGPASLALFVPAAVLCQFIIAFITYRYFFIIEYDYTLTDDELTVYEVHNRRISRKKISLELKDSEIIAPYRGRFLERLDSVEYRKKMCCVSDDRKDCLYYIVFGEDGDKTLLLIEPNEKMITAFSHYIFKTAGKIN